MNKKSLIIATVIMLVMTLNLTADNKNLNIVTTLFPEYDFARAVVGKKANLTMLLKPGSEAHSYEPTPRDIKKIAKCDLFIYTGSENDVWVEKIFASLAKRPKTIKLLDLVDTVEEEIVEGMQNEARHHDEETEIDEHVWTSPKNAAKIVVEFGNIISSIDEANAPFYRENADSYASKILEIDSQLADIVNNAKRTTLVFGDRFPFRYFADEFRLKYFAAFPGCATDVEASAATIKFLINKVKEEQIPVVFAIEFSNGKITDTICESTGAIKRELHSAHTVTADEFKNGITYTDLWRRNIESLKAALY